MNALQIRHQAACSPEVWIDNQWIYVHDLLLIAELLTQGRNPLVARETSGLREECASDLSVLMDFWGPIDADVTLN
jgi:hypothetical protein